MSRSRRVRILLETATQQSPDARRRCSRQRAPSPVRARGSAAIVSETVSPSNGLAAGEHLVQHAAERPDVGALVDRFAARLFGAHVRRGAENHARRVSRRPSSSATADGRRVESATDGFGQTEVEHLHRRRRRELDVGRLQIAVDDALARAPPRARRRSAARSQRLVRPAAARARAASASVWPSTSSRTSAWTPSRLLDAVDRADVRMIERGQHARLALESRAAAPDRSPNASGRTLIATSRPSRVSRAR